jgi:hypothetical protein
LWLFFEAEKKGVELLLLFMSFSSACPSADWWKVENGEKGR